MPFEYIWEERGFYSKFWGQILDSDIEVKNKYFSSDPRSDKCRYQIFDGSEVESFVLSKGGIKRMASNDIGMGYYLKDFSVVLISADSEIRNAFKRYISTCLKSNSTWRFHICDTLKDAREWLQELEEKRQRSYIDPTQNYPIHRTPIKKV